jgi:hypothetical protein
MTARAINLHEWIEEFRHSAVMADLHPAAPATIDHWLRDMHHAALAADANEVGRLVGMINDKIALERRWQREDQEPL